MDGVAIYDFALSADQVADEMAGRAVRDDGMVRPNAALTYQATLTNSVPAQAIDGYLYGATVYLTPSIDMPLVYLSGDHSDLLTNYANSISGEASGFTCPADRCPSSQSGPAGMGNAAQFNNDYLNLPSVSQGFDSQTIGFWLRPNSLPDAGTTETIFDTASDGIGALDIRLDENGKLIVDVNSTIYRYSYDCDVTQSCASTETGWRDQHTTNATLSVNQVGNRTATSVGTVLLDARASSADANLWQLPTTNVITDTIAISGTVSDLAQWAGEVAVYHFEASGDTFYDSSATQAHATCTNCPARTASPFGQGVTFDGSDDTIITDNLFNPFSDTFSIALWFNIDATGSGQRVLVQQADAAGRSLIWLDNSNRLATNLGGSGNNASTSATADEW